MTEKIEEDARKAVEFVMRVKPYTRSDIMSMDILTFMAVLAESEAEQIEKNIAMKQFDSKQ